MVLCSTWFQVLCEAAHSDVRVVNQVGQASHVGLLQVAMSSGDFGTVCGLNPAGADVACKQLGYCFAQCMRNVWRGWFVWRSRVAGCYQKLKMRWRRNELGRV